MLSLGHLADNVHLSSQNDRLRSLQRSEKRLGPTESPQQERFFHEMKVILAPPLIAFSFLITFSFSKQREGEGVALVRLQKRVGIGINWESMYSKNRFSFIIP